MRHKFGLVVPRGSTELLLSMNDIWLTDKTCVVMLCYFKMILLHVWMITCYFILKSNCWKILLNTFYFIEINNKENNKNDNIDNR